MPLLSPSDTAFAEHWHALDSAEVLRRCGTDPAVGLSADLAAQRLLAVMDDLTAEDSGGFFNHQGERLPW